VGGDRRERFLPCPAVGRRSPGEGFGFSGGWRAISGRSFYLQRRAGGGRRERFQLPVRGLASSRLAVAGCPRARTRAPWYRPIVALQSTVSGLPGVESAGPPASKLSKWNLTFRQVRPRLCSPCSRVPEIIRSPNGSHKHRILLKLGFSRGYYHVQLD
jgi:hypothetical protein